MSASTSQHATRPTSLRLSDHVRQRLRYDCDRRCIDRQIISQAILEGEWGTNPGGDGNAAIEYEVAGITFEVIADSDRQVVVTAYPVEIQRFDAITSNRWTQVQIRSVEERVREGLTRII